MIEVSRLSKHYGEVRAVDDISFSVRPGAVTGFLGPNGAGKTTAMRVMVGLTPPTSGVATVLGHRYADLPNPARQVGVLLDASAQHGGRTGREVLTLGALMMGLNRDRVDEMLALVGLTDKEAKQRLRHYSLGMRQRLGIAHALLGEPDVLILDEPANGLDPQGIRWMRGLLRAHADRGGTVLLSSHLLHEVEQIADELILIGRGKIVAQGHKTELLSGSGTRVIAADPAGLTTAVQSAGLTVDQAPDGALLVGAEPDEVGRLALGAGVALIDLRPAQGAGLEQLFFDLTADSSREGIPA